MKLENLVIFFTCLDQNCILVSPKDIVMHVSGTLVGVLTPFRLSFYLLCNPPKNVTDNFIWVPFDKHNVYKHTEAQISKKLSILLSLIFCILTVKSNWLH